MLLLSSLLLITILSNTALAASNQTTNELEGCNPACSSNGKCVDGVCFCAYPYTGDTCD
jgi:hypothetical protein